MSPLAHVNAANLVIFLLVRVRIVRARMRRSEVVIARDGVGLLQINLWICAHYFKCPSISNQCNNPII